MIPEWIAWFRSLPHVRTPSGGWHYYMRRVEGQRPRTHGGAILNLDIRAGFQNDAGEWESSGLAYVGCFTEGLLLRRLHPRSSRCRACRDRPRSLRE